MALQHLRSSTANKRPLPAGMSDGQLAVNTNNTSPGLFFKNSAGALVKVGPVHVGATAPNASPAGGGETGNSVGEQWLDTSGTNPVLKIWDGSAWQSETGEFVNASGDTMTGALVMDNQQQVRFRETTANGTNYIALQAPAAVASDKTLTLPDVTGTLVSTGDTGSVTSTMIADGTIVNADINASAAIAGSKIQAASTSNAGAVQLTDSTSSTSTTTAATPNAVKSAYDLADAALPKAGGALTGDVTLNAQSDLRFADADSSNWVALQGPATVSSNVTWTLPSADGTSGQVLSTNGSGTLSWATASGGGGSSITQGNTTAEVIDTGSDGRFVVTTEGSERLRVDSSGRLGVGTASPGGVLEAGAVSGSVTSGDLLVTTGSTTARVTVGRLSGTSNDNTSFRVRNRVDSTLFQVDSTAVTFGPTGTEAARIDSSGRLLVGTSSAPSAGDGQYSRIVAQGYTGLATGHGYMSLARGQAAASISSGDEIGTLAFTDSAGYSFARISCTADAPAGSNDYPGRLVFSTTADGASSPTERARITSAGASWATTTGSYRYQAATCHEFTVNNNGEYALFISNTNSTSPLGVVVKYDTDINNTANTPFKFQGGTTDRFVVRSNGGLANYQANDVNLSDINAKKDISPAAGTWDCLKQWEIVNYRYKDQPDDADLNLGVIAQQVAESCPEVITVFEEATEDQPEKLGIKEQQMYWMAIKALQEAQVRIEALEAEVAALKAS